MYLFLRQCDLLYITWAFVVLREEWANPGMTQLLEVNPPIGARSEAHSLGPKATSQEPPPVHVASRHIFTLTISSREGPFVVSEDIICTKGNRGVGLAGRNTNTRAYPPLLVKFVFEDPGEDSKPRRSILQDALARYNRLHVARRLETYHPKQTHHMIVLDNEFTILCHTLMEFAAIESMIWSYQQCRYQRTIDAASHGGSPSDELQGLPRSCSIAQRLLHQTEEDHTAL